MTKIKISMFALAFVFATGAAFATNSKTGDVCLDHPGRDSNQCQAPLEEECCITASQTILGVFTN